MRTYFEEERFGVRVMRRESTASGGPTLICFPCAGGSAALFRRFFAHLPEHVRALAVDPPGHGYNKGVPLYRIEAMVDVYYAALRGWFDGPYYLLGHSLGGLVAYLLASRIEEAATHARPNGVIVCASNGPERPVRELWSEKSDDELIDKMDGIGGLFGALREDKALVRQFLPAIRADFEALERYRHPARRRLETPLYVLAAEADPFVTRDAASKWLSHARRATFHDLVGGHFFVQTHPQPAARKVLELFAA